MDQYINAIQQSVAQNNAWSAEQAQKQMDFQREMSNTAHQREIADLKAAGLNPVLSAKLGGASTPNGAMATGDTSGTSALVDLLQLSMETANSAAGAARAAANSLEGSESSPTSFLGGHVTVDMTDSEKQVLKKGADTVMRGLVSGSLTTVARGFMQIVSSMKSGFVERSVKMQPSFQAQMEEVAPLMLEVASAASAKSTAKTRPEYVEDGKYKPKQEDYLPTAYTHKKGRGILPMVLKK